jgi:hypothetical protein
MACLPEIELLKEIAKNPKPFVRVIVLSAIIKNVVKEVENERNNKEK